MTLMELQATPQGAWRDQAACKGLDGVGFFVSIGEQISRQARRLCESCKVSDECYEYALRTRQPAGMWGGKMIWQKGMAGYRKSAGYEPREETA